MGGVEEEEVVVGIECMRELKTAANAWTIAGSWRHAYDD